MSKALDQIFTALPEKLSIDQLTDVLGLSARTVTYKWLREGNVPAMKLGGSWLILRDDVKEHLERSYNVLPGMIGTPSPDDDHETSSAVPADETKNEDQDFLPDPAVEDPTYLALNQRASRAESQLIRKWARDNGLDPNPRGRLARSIVDAYNAAQK
ncbi:helix-turn-helix domain-containing protein [Vibrio cholerae]|nr:helix-turn-helix domain-containing protein [Vibrio cholerae]